MEEKKLWPMPIDNKHILEDFTDDFHDGDFVEYVEGSIRHQAFWCCGALWVLSYQFGSNWFSFNFVSGTDGRRKLAEKKIAEILIPYRENYVIKEGPGGVYLIFKEEK